ncbi:MAG TPA: hypothetical protein VGX37_05825 [Allosphingosinicella sp.]|jgi:hypothetical protein|nr:hypothetical protein [Allosphingosinicella sp.]
MTGPGAALLSVLVITAFAMAGGGVYLLAIGRDRRKGALMLLAAAVMFANVLILTL